MVVFDIKLICPKTNEVLFSSINNKPILPPNELYNRIPQPLLVITTRGSESEVKKSA